MANRYFSVLSVSAKLAHCFFVSVGVSFFCLGYCRFCGFFGVFFSLSHMLKMNHSRNYIPFACVAELSEAGKTVDLLRSINSAAP